MMNISTLPKAELHCHVDGIVDVAMLQALEQQGHILPLASATLQATYPVRNFDEFIHWFDVTEPIEDDTKNFWLILAQHIARLKAQHVVYAELMLGSSELPRDDGQLIEQFSAFREYVTTLEDGKIQVEFLVALRRTLAIERFEVIVKRVMRLRKANLLFGVALAGWPETSIQPLSRVLARLHDAGVGVEIHAGEWAGPELVWDALEHGFPDRIGHGCALFQDPRLIERFQRDQIHIEMCPTSNLKTGSVATLEQHPIRRARDLELNFSVNTDDPGPFENSMESEYELLATLFEFQLSDFERMYVNTLAARFQPQLRYLETPSNLPI
jgi:adenosine deaminase